MGKPGPFRYFKTSPDIIRLAVMLYVRFPLSLRNVEDLLHERGTDICHETVRFWWHRFGPMFAAEIRDRRVGAVRSSRWLRHLDEVFVKIDGERHYLWRAVDHEGEVLESFVTKRRDKKAALKFLKKSLKRHGRVDEIVTDRLRYYEAVIPADHAGHEREVAVIRRLTANLSLSDGACGTWTGLYRGLEEFTRDLTEYMRLENDVLFPQFEMGRRANV